MKFQELAEMMIANNASDLFVRVNSTLKARINSEVKEISSQVVSQEDMDNLLSEIVPKQLKDDLSTKRSCEFAVWHKEHWRFRVGAFYQRNSLAMCIRKIDLRIPSFEDISLPPEVLSRFCNERRGIILLTGITGSGKSTTIASMIEHMNQSQGKHILTIEEPIEFTYTDKQAIINQRELNEDVFSYGEALRQFAVLSPDVIFIGQIRDMETCYSALTAAETGALVLSTLHTVNAAKTIERIVNFFPPHQHSFILTQLSTLLKGVVCMRLLPRSDNSGLVPAYEIMTLSPTISRLLRENKAWEIPKYIAQGNIYGMNTFDQSLIELVEKKLISVELALEYADKKEELEMNLRNKGLLQ